MKIDVREKENVVVLDLKGNVDINASNFIEIVGWALNNKIKNILCNFQGVNSVDYVGISIIAIAYKNVLNHKARLKLYNVPFRIKDLFSIVGLDRAVECYKTQQQALNSFKEDKVISKILEKQLRRQFKRAIFKRIIEYKQKSSPKAFFYKGRILNLSAVGVFITVQKLFSIGEILTSRIYLFPKQEPLEVDTEIIWLAGEKRQPQYFPAMGLKFCKIAAWKQEIIVEFVERNLANSNL